MLAPQSRETSACVAVMKFSVLALVVAVQGSVHASRNYPKIVSWERTNSASFVSEPNLLEGVDNFVPSVIHSVPGRREEHVYTNREIPGEKLSCINNPTSTEPRLKTMRRDLPGAFVCEKKTLFVIPVIQVELHRFFNVSLDFLKLQNPDKIRLLRFQPLPEGISVELSPVGIVSVSGIFREGEGTLALRLSFYNASGETKPFYKIKVLFYIKTGEEKPNRQRIEVRMAHDQTAVRASDAPEQIRAIKCASEAVSLPPWSFCGVNSESEFAKELTLRASVEIPEGSCPTEPRKSEAPCGPFVITEILFNSTKCDWSSRRSSEGSPQLDQRPGDGSDSVESQVNDAGYEMEVVLKNNEFVTGPPASVSTSTPAPTTLPPQDLGADPALVESEKPAGLDNDADLDSIASSTPGGRVLQNGVTDQIMEDPRLKTAMYGLLGLAGIVFTVIFLFLFSRLELCKKKTGYDPVFMTRLSDENAKIA